MVKFADVVLDVFLGNTIPGLSSRKVEMSMTIEGGVCPVVWFPDISVAQDLFVAEKSLVDRRC